MSDRYTQQQYYCYPPTVIVQTRPKGRSISGFVLGFVSFGFGWTLIVPVVGLILSGLGLQREPSGKTFAIWGLVLNGLAVLGWLIGVILIVATFQAAHAISSSYGY
ncbi:hypothetical protein [Gryllotalpicola protaetiae]|uniref:hypothetical protein n=1 Tax=Gryllotalpicola protaetiae TaxID=2419771 RepID=UPI0013C3F71E|nr:hypothetical protein [Gryllotalpicola protaetiae]